MANSKFVRLYYSEITETNDLVFWNTKLNIENDEEMLDEIYKAFNVFIDTVDAHQNDLIPYFNKLCVNTVVKALFYNEDTSFMDFARVDIDHLTLTLFDEWCENNEINLNELLF